MRIPREVRDLFSAEELAFAEKIDASMLDQVSKILTQLPHEMLVASLSAVVICTSADPIDAAYRMLNIVDTAMKGE